MNESVGNPGFLIEIGIMQNKQKQRVLNKNHNHPNLIFFDSTKNLPGNFRTVAG